MTILLLLLDVSVLVVINSVTNGSPFLTNAIWDSKNIFAEQLSTDLSRNGRNLIIPLFSLLDIGVSCWRLIRGYRQVQLRHIISKLHYITNGNYDHCILFELSDDLSRVVVGTNRLVDSTVVAIENERKIEESKDELITNISHDIRTPLTSITGYLGLVEDGQYHSEEDLLKYIHTAYIRVKQVESLVDGLLKYTKVCQLAAPVNFSVFDTIQLIERLAADFELEAFEKNIQILVQSRVDSLIVDSDIERLVRVSNNLLTNTLKYGKGTTKIVIEVERTGSEAVATVKNNGAMTPQQTIDNLFDRLYRIEESRSQTTGGTGLGSAIAQSIVALHGGYIYAKSDKQWTPFIMHLPIKKSEKLPIGTQEIIGEN